MPLVPCLIDGVRYFKPEDLPASVGEELRPMMRPRIPQPMRTPRAPSLRTLVRTALRCESAEQLGQKLRRRYDRQKQRRGIKTGPDRAAEAELERLLAE